MKDLLVKTANPKALDQTLNQMGALVMQDPDGSYPQVKDGAYRVRALNGDTGFLKFTIQRQGYGQVIGEIDDSLLTENQISQPDLDLTNGKE